MINDWECIINPKTVNIELSEENGKHYDNFDSAGILPIVLGIVGYSAKLC